MNCSPHRESTHTAILYRPFRAIDSINAIQALGRTHHGLILWGWDTVGMWSEAGMEVGVWVSENKSKLLGERIENEMKTGGDEGWGDA